MITGEAIAAVVFLGVALLLPASVILYKGRRYRERYRLVRDTSELAATTGRPDEPVFVTGPVGADTSVTGPVSDEAAAFVVWSIEGWRDSGKLKQWMPGAHGVRCDRLRVETDDGSVVVSVTSTASGSNFGDRLTGYETLVGVDTAEAHVEIDEFDCDREVAPDETPPERLQRLRDEVDVTEPSDTSNLIDLGRTHGTHRYREHAVESGERLTVRGTLSTPAEPGEAPRVTEPEDDPLLISTLSPDELAKRYRRAYWRLFYGPLTVIGLVLAGALVLLSI
ncbi:GIDE domain-containing protein [Halobaculum sp. MBLA0147]|uniref:GIDE domain-containing protein n=1 Tax=Halobaculum sp. MBLA0147 TaxID=3079934 RepID=UPI003524C753